jgi:Domain of unknown function (DUF4145)
MTTLVNYCPRCNAQNITFDVEGQSGTCKRPIGVIELFCVCRNCLKSTIYRAIVIEHNMVRSFSEKNGIVNADLNLNYYFRLLNYVAIHHHVSKKPPDYLPDDINMSFKEGASCMAIDCYNAAATMFRLCVDLATRPMLPKPDEQDKPKPNSRERRDLGLRLGWLFDNKLLPEALRELASCIREDANDGAHVGNLSKEDGENLCDFTSLLLERLFTEPKRIELAEARREERRKPQTQAKGA